MKKEILKLYNDFIADWLVKRRMDITPHNIIIARAMTSLKDFMEWMEGSTL